MIADFLNALVRANLIIACAVCLCLALRPPARHWLGAGTAYAIWLLVPASALACLIPQPAFVPIGSGVGLPRTAEILGSLDVLQPSIAPAAFGLWLAGSLLAAALVLGRQIRFLGLLGRLEPMQPGRVRAESGDLAPAVLGVLRPVIVTPSDFDSRYTAQEQTLVLAHERAHLRHADPQINALTAAIQCLCWFNPLVHVAAHFVKFDQELACDAAVVQRFPASTHDYGQVLLKSQLASERAPLGCQWPANSPHPLTERVRALEAAAAGPFRRVMGVAFVAVLAVCGADAAWALRPSANAAGAWTVFGEIRTAGHLVRAAPVCSFKQEGEELTGLCEGPRSRGAAVGRVIGQRVSWRWDHSGFRGQGLGGESSFNGVIGQDHTLTGSWSYSGLPGAVGTFTGKRR